MCMKFKYARQYRLYNHVFQLCEIHLWPNCVHCCVLRLSIGFLYFVFFCGNRLLRSHCADVQAQRHDGARHAGSIVRHRAVTRPCSWVIPVFCKQTTSTELCVVYQCNLFILSFLGWRFCSAIFCARRFFDDSCAILFLLDKSKNGAR